MALGLLLISSALHAAERRPSVGESLAMEGRCPAALPELERELAEAPANAHAAWRLGQCALRLGDYPRATGALETALASDPSLTEAQLDLARARYHAGDLDGADTALRAAEALSEDALWQLYRGMIDLKRGDAKAAVKALERAVEINRSTWRTRSDPEAVEPIASYYLGLALREAGEDARAQTTLRGVAEDWAGTEWAVEAHRAIRAQARRAWLTLSAGMEHDDNVVLAGRDTPLPEDISSQSDFRGVWGARGGFDLGRWGDTAAGALGSYRGRAQVDGDLREFDSHFPTASLWLNQALTNQTHLRLVYDFAYAWVDTDPFLLANTGRLSLLHAWSGRQITSVHASLFGEEYFFSSLDFPDGPGAPGQACGTLPDPFTVCGPPGLNERRARDRDGWGTGGGIAHSLPIPLGWFPLFPIADPSLRSGYTYTNFSSDGVEYSRQSHLVFLGVGILLPFGIGLDLDASFDYRDYRHPTTFPEQPLDAGEQYFLSGKRRREQVYNAGANLIVPIYGPFSTSAYYHYRDQHSTADVFDYDQHVVGLTFNVTFARER